MSHITIVKNRRAREANYRAPSPPRRLMEKHWQAPLKPPAQVRLGNAAVPYSGLEVLRRAIPLTGLMKTAAWYAECCLQAERDQWEEYERGRYAQAFRGSTTTNPMSYNVIHIDVPTYSIANSSVGLTPATFA